jgi:hypothetical protein
MMPGFSKGNAKVRFPVMKFFETHLPSDRANFSTEYLSDQKS